MAAAGKMEPIEELVRLTVLQLRRSTATQAETISELNRMGFGDSRIAELLGTTANTVHVALAKAKKRQAKNQPTKKRAEGDT